MAINPISSSSSFAPMAVEDGSSSSNSSSAVGAAAATVFSSLSSPSSSSAPYVSPADAEMGKSTKRKPDEADSQEPNKKLRLSANDAYSKARRLFKEAMELSSSHKEEANSLYVEAIQLFQEAAEQEHLKAQEELGWIYLNGKGVSKNLDEAEKFLKSAAIKGSLPSQYSLSLLYFERGKNQSALYWLQRAHDENYAPALNHMAMLYRKGPHVGKDLSKAIALFFKAAKLGNAEAQYNFAMIKFYGENGVEVDQINGLRLFEEAIAQGHTKAKYRLGVILHRGIGVPPQWDRAADLLRSAVLEGFPQAMAELGNMYEFGHGIPSDLGTAISLYRRGALLGNERCVAELRHHNL
jgi:TPR repeat protein